MFVRLWAGERDLVTILVSTISFLMYISVVMDCVSFRVLNLSSILSSNGRSVLKPEDGPHTGPKHVVVSPMY